jgi:hypothetical protein
MEQDHKAEALGADVVAVGPQAPVENVSARHAEHEFSINGEIRVQIRTARIAGHA